MSKTKQYMIALLISVIAIGVLTSALWIDNKKKEQVAYINEQEDRLFEQREHDRIENEKKIRQKSVDIVGEYINRSEVACYEYDYPNIDKRYITLFKGKDGNTFEACTLSSSDYEMGKEYSISGHFIRSK